MCEQNPCASQPRCFISGVALTLWLWVRERARFTWVAGRRDHSASSLAASESVRGLLPVQPPNQKEMPMWSEGRGNVTFPAHTGVCFIFHPLRALLISRLYTRLLRNWHFDACAAPASCVGVFFFGRGDQGIKMTKIMKRFVLKRLYSRHLFSLKEESRSGQTIACG